MDSSSGSDRLNPSVKAKFVGQRGAELNSQTTLMGKDLFPNLCVLLKAHSFKKSVPENI